MECLRIRDPAKNLLDLRSTINVLKVCLYCVAIDDYTRQIQSTCSCCKN